MCALTVVVALIAESGIVLFSIPREKLQPENDAVKGRYSVESLV